MIYKTIRNIQDFKMLKQNETLDVSFDIECFVNYFLIMAVHRESRHAHKIQMYNDNCMINDTPCTRLMAIDHALELISGDYMLISFNGVGYDQIVLNAFINYADNKQLQQITKRIIEKRNLTWWVYEKEFGTKLKTLNHVDIMNVLRGNGSLKQYGARIGSKVLKELPTHNNGYLMPHQTKEIDRYCFNDNVLNCELYDEIITDVEMRIHVREDNDVEKDLRSVNDSRIAQNVFLEKYKAKTNKTLNKPTNVKKSFKYCAPDWVSFETPYMQDLLTEIESTEFGVDKGGKLCIPENLNKIIRIGNKGFQLGVGGLHSIEDRGSYYAGTEHKMFEIDVRGFYPTNIMNNKFFPTHIDNDLFAEIYGGFLKLKNDLTDEKATCKKEELTTLLKRIYGVKILLNSTYGLLNDRSSHLYSPITMLHVTLTGQLALFMLLEQLHKHGVEILSANTDGINVKVKNEDYEFIDSVVKWWENVTNFSMDYNYYESLHYRDVNAYFYTKKDSDPKGINIFKGMQIGKNVDQFVVGQAVMQYVDKGVNVESFIREFEDINGFIMLRKVKGGAIKDGELLGGVIRWYISTETDTAINYLTSGNRVPKSAHGRPIMNLPDHISEVTDIDYDYYIEQAYKVMDICEIEYERG